MADESREKNEAATTLDGRSDETFRILAENVPGVVYLCDNDERYTVRYVNAAVEELTGTPPEEFLTDRACFADIFHPDDVAQIRSGVDEAIARRRHYKLDYRIRHASGDWRWVEEYGQGVFDGDGNLRFLEGTIFDISDRKEAEEKLRESEQRFRTLAEAAFEGIVLSENAVILDANRQMADMLGYPRDEIVGRSSIDFAAPESREIAAQNIGAGVTDAYEVIAVRRDGERRNFEVRGRAMPHQGRMVRVTVVRDITEHKRIQNELRAARDEMECRVEERTAELAEANQVLRDERETLKALLARLERDRKLLAYEIHDGLVQEATGALMHLEAALSNLETDAAQAKSNLEKSKHWLRRSIDEARRLISGLRPPALDELGLVTAIEYLLQKTEWPEELRADFEHDESFRRLPAELETDLFRIAQEALTNVRRHSQSDRVLVRLVENDDRIRLSVQDWGTGFDPAEVRSGSFGLRGMKERAKAHDGTLAVESTPGQGTKIIAEFPLPK